MAGLSWIDIFLRLIPEGLIIILAGYAISKKTINVKVYLLSGIVLAGLTFLFRTLPISIILHMVLSEFAAVILLVFLNRIGTVQAILSTIICFILSAFSELVNILLLGKIFQIDTNKIFLESNALVKNLYGLPSLFLFGLIVVSYYLISVRKAKN